MRRQRSGTFTRTDAGSFVPDNDPNPIATELKCSHVSLNYEIRDWSIVSTMAATPDKAPERREFDTHQAHPPRREIHLRLKNERRRLHTLRCKGTCEITGEFNFRINGNDGEATEGFFQHSPAYESDNADDCQPEAIFGGASLPMAQFQWLLAELEKPSAKLHFRMIAPLYKQAIALSFDRPSMSQDIYLPYDEMVALRGFDFSVVYGPKLPPEPETPLHEYEDVTLIDAAPEPPTPEPMSVVRDPRLNWLIFLLVVLIAAVLFRR